MGGWRGERGALSLGLILLSHLLLSGPPSCRGQDVKGAPPYSPQFSFTGAVYYATVYENSAARTYLKSQAKMGISLTQRSWEIRFRITSGDEEGLFKAEEHVVGDFCFLRIRTKGGNAAILNREIQDNYVLTVKAAVKGDALLEAWAKVHIQVLDMNDLRPLFSPTTYSVTITEDTPLRASIAQVTATDADIGPNGEFYYFFKDRVELFAVHPTSGVVFLSGKLNVDERKQYDLEILAVDRGTKLYGNNGVSSTAKLFVRVERANRHAPLMDVVAHDSLKRHPNPVYAVVTVEDADQGLNGEIDSVVIVDPIGVFSVNRSNGNEFTVTAAKPISWDAHPDGFNLTLQAKDRGTPQRVSETHVIHVTEKAGERTEAKFDRELYKVSLNEFSPPGTIVLAVEMKPEPQNAEYRLKPSADSLFFQINSMKGVISTTRWLTQETQSIFNLEVTEISSELRVKVCVAVQDANDNTPSFSHDSYVVSISESVPVGTSVLAVSALDKDQGENGYITYSIASPEPLPFIINQFSGVVSTAKELDFESSESFEFAVRASDWGSPYRRESEVNVTVRLDNVNDNPPAFEKLACHGVVSRDFQVHRVLTTMSAIDIDDLALVKYKIVSGNELEYFDLDADSGALTLRRSLATAGPQSDAFSLRITATDGENLSDPVFVNISVAPGEHAQTPSVSCEETRVAQKLAEKLMKKSRFTAKPKLEEDFIDIFSTNRQPPQFVAGFPTDVAVREDLKVGSSVYKVDAYDGDAGFNGQIVFSISSGNTDSCFTIDMERGLMSVFLPLDREKRDHYVLNVTVNDLGLPSKSAWHLLTVHVQDANDNAPLFLQSRGYTVVIPENTAIGKEVIQVGATDKDLGANGEILYSILTRTTHFGINSTNGVVYVAGQLDREFVSTFSLKIEARDQAEPGRQKFTVTTLKVILQDVNDCPPRFIPSVYKARAREDLPVGTVVAWLETQDPDLGLGGQVRFSLASDYSGWFEIDKASGVIRLMKELDYESQQFYNLTVKAKDKGKPVSLLSVTHVEVEVVDVNENLRAPYFTDFAVTGLVKENSSIGTTVVQVAANDEDSGKDGEIQYSIHDGTGLGLFAIDEGTGVLSFNDEFTASVWFKLCLVKDPQPAGPAVRVPRSGT